MYLPSVRENKYTIGLAQALEEYCKKNNVSPSEVIRQAIIKQIKFKKNEKRTNQNYSELCEETLS